MSGIRALGYVRLSRLTEASTSVERQREIIASACDARGWELVGIEEDVDVSATSKGLEDRPGLLRARARFLAKEAEVLVCWRLDRLARSVGDFSVITGGRRGDWGIKVASATEPLDTTSPMGQAMAQVLQVFAELEAKTIGLRAAASIDYLRRTGRRAGGPVPYGWRLAPNPDGPGAVWELDPETAPLVRDAVDRVLSGESIASVAYDWTVNGVPATRFSKSGQWERTSLSKLLRNPVLAGMTVHRGDVIRDEGGIPRVDPRFALITREERRKLLAVLASRMTTRAAGAGEAARPLLFGLLRCDACDSVMYRARPSARGGAARYFCQDRACIRKHEAPSIHAEYMDAYVEGEVLRRLGRSPVVETIEEAEDGASPTELRDAEEALSETLTALGTADDEDTEAELLRRLRTLRRRLAELREQAVPAAPRRLVRLGETFGDAWAAEGVVGRRRLLSRGVDFIIVRKGVRGRRAFDPQRVTIQWTEVPYVEPD